MRELDATGGAVSPRELVASLRLGRGDGRRPRVAAAMIASADGRATVGGRSVGMGNDEDRDLLRELRTGVDCVLAGARTLVAEKYADLLDADQRAHRRARGMVPHPVVATVDRAGRLSASDVPLFAEADVRVVVFSEHARELSGAAADVEVVGLGDVDFPRLLAHLAEHEGVRSVSCEGGPRLLRELVAQGCLDELLLTVAPLLVAGDGPASLDGGVLDPVAELRLAGVHRSGEHLFLRYQPA